MKLFARGFVVVCFAAFSLGAAAQQYFSYSGVTRVVRLRILPGKTSEFYQYLGNVNKVLAAEKAAGLIVDYGFAHTINYEGPEKYDVAIVIDYKDMATFDTLSDKTDPLVTKVYGSPEARAAAGKLAAESSEVVGSELVRGIKVK
jgi:hypothetical protein